MDIAGVVLAVLSEGDRLVALVITLKDARSEIEDRVAKIQSHWVRTQAQLDFAKRAWIGLSKDHRTIQLSTLKRLQSKVESAEHRIQGLIGKQTRATATPDQKLKIKRMKYLFVKPCLDSVIDDLVQWQTLYDPTFYLMMKIASPIIDAELQRKDPGASREANCCAAISKKGPERP
ncbi:uncharacterized protein RCC_10113 [Ramularia collo-cygni]|uniref:Uncharacterized protein n=1 Tax=Ramularia collo-cygni TaxID=112498 RepID=A0A2D3VQH6_9PEZI|nr:uncharacterized protein RCC_10113 [Ramularia collo-cygni]CZT24388.1 uncharacterized protein RCC_10113 [Ramularia collo-cygni]